MSLNNYFRKYTRTFFKDSSVSDTRQVVANGATVTIYRQGATIVFGTTVTTSPTVVDVFDSGRIAVSDVVQLGTDATKQALVTAVTSTTITIQSTVGGSFAVSANDRLVPYNALPTIYSESTGTLAIANPTTANSRGLVEIYIGELLVDVIVSGTGLTTTLYPNEESGFHHRTNVRDYGAVGNGVTNDTAAIAAAFASIPAAGGDVYFPPGTYRITSAVSPESKTRIHGEGASSIILDGTGNISLLDLTGADDIDIESIALQGSGAAAVASRGAIFSGTGGSDRVRIEGVYITNAGTCGISLTDSNEVDIIGCTIRSSLEHGVFLSACTKVTVSSNTIVSSGAIGSGLQAGVYVVGNSSRIIVSNNVIDVVENIGLRIVDSSDNVFSGNMIRAVPTGILLSNAARNLIAGNQITETTSIGISVTNLSDRTWIANNVINVTSGTSITIAASVPDTQLLNNSVMTGGITDNGTRTTKVGNKATIVNAYYNVQTDLNLASGVVVRVNGTQVLSSQGALIGDVTPTTGTAQDGSARIAINSILARLRAHGIIAT